MPLKILQLVPEALPTFRPDVALLFGKYLPRHQVVCDVVGTGQQAPAELQGFASARRSAFHGRRWRRELSFVGLCLRALWGADKANCDVIQVRDMVTIGLAGMWLARLKGIPFVYWVSYPMCEGRIDGARQRLAQKAGWWQRLVLFKGLLEKRLLYRLVLPGAAHIFVQSDAMRDWLAGQGLPRASMTAVPMGVDMELLARPPQAGPRPDGWHARPMLAYLGSLEKSRRLESVIDALSILRRSMPEACLLLIGSSTTLSDNDDLLDYARRQGLADGVRVTGWLPSEQAWQLLMGADAAVSYIPRGALYDVSSPTKLLEYLALGIPAIANDIPDQVQVLAASQAGWLTASDPAAMAAAMAQVLSDVDAARRRAAAGPAYIESARSYRVLAQAVARQYHQIAGRVPAHHE
ncbi:glycosyltransferase [Janthinobacterium agaricidamnosum]|uniref:Glycosyl transferases group 1 family protein n=1 Tax=Janthinobacterium agaricidamnosum NBRC 102515 = DSM 9628 TaxID=1349767 RepID=W0V9N0_9BURK|nr:glycosyltransferase [Janthinobacterium agaricidamnosum]CDG84601.1 glycosyl transferases group 1 family protein [Janthinobacterium agaricidamnosum NBRC 102515 = DSM 9628]